MSKANVDNEKKICNSFKRQIKFLNEYVNSYQDSLINRVNLQERITGLNKGYEKFNEIQCDGNPEIFEKITNQYYDALAGANVLQNDLKNIIPEPSTEIVPQDLPGPSYQHSKMPMEEIPHFNGRIEDWPTYKTQFERIILSNSKLNDTQKLQYLKSSLHGEAANTIRVDETNYKVAWQSLLDKYYSKRDLILRHTDLLLKTIPMPDDTLQSRSKLANDMDDHVHALLQLTHSWSSIGTCVVTSIALSRMQESVQQKWKQKFTDMPRFLDTCKFLREDLSDSPETHRQTRNRTYGRTSPSSKRSRH